MNYWKLATIIFAFLILFEVFLLIEKPYINKTNLNGLQIKTDDLKSIVGLVYDNKISNPFILCDIDKNKCLTIEVER